MSDYSIVSGGEGARLPFPLADTWISFECTSENSSFLIGDTEGMCVEEVIRVCVLTPKEEGSASCRETAEAVCQAMLVLDEEKRIISIAAGKCVLDEHTGGRRIEIVFGLRGIRQSGG